MPDLVYEINVLCPVCSEVYTIETKWPEDAPLGRPFTLKIECPFCHKGIQKHFDNFADLAYGG
jgi:hypothetical protein